MFSITINKMSRLEQFNLVKAMESACKPDKSHKAGQEVESTFHYESHHSPQWKWTQDYDVLRCPHFGKCDQFQILSRNLPPAKCHKPLCHQHSTVILIFVNSDIRPLCLDECSSLLIGICIFFWKATQAISFSPNTVSHQQEPYKIC